MAGDSVSIIKLLNGDCLDLEDWNFKMREYFFDKNSIFNVGCKKFEN